MKEILQHHVARVAKHELTQILDNESHYNRIKKDYTEMKTILGHTGASKKTARGIYNFVINRK